MKKTLFSIMLTIAAFPFISQAQNSNPWPTNGSVGIGTTTPTAKLEVNSGTGESALRVVGPKGYLIVDNVGSGETYYQANVLHQFQGNGGTPILTMFGGGNVGVGTLNPIGKFDIRGNVFIGTSDLSIGSTGSFVQIDQGAGTGNTYTQIRAFSNGGNATNNLILQNSGGRVGIGTSTPDHLLCVKGTIHSQEVKVDMTGWSDYVFDASYQLPSLSSVQAYIAKNHHLPEVPPAQEIIKNGLDLGEMNKLLMKKVEELTLYLIEQNKRVEKLEAQLNAKKK